jgi:zona occludens toxin
MLVFNEGVPRAGKSYDAVKNHILPTLKKRRRVFARLNGLHHQRIAEYLGMPVEEVEQLLTLVDTKDVKTMFACVKHPETGQWCIPDAFKDSLVVIDEVHEFYVSERQPLPDAVENFWALLGQNGGDAVIMTQWINRVHQAVRARIERKNVFQKLTAVGLKNRYRVTYWHTTSPGKYERVGGKTEKYDAKIYPLYHGYAVGADNTEVYDEGGTNVWKAMALRGTLFGAVGLAGAYVFISFFTSGGSGLSKKADEEKRAASTPGMVAQPSASANPSVSMPGLPVKAGAPDPLESLSQEQRYVAALSDRHRVRLALTASFGDRQVGMVEWVDSSGNTAEQLTFDALVALGYRIKVAPYGVRLTAGEYAVVATPWPREAPRRSEDARLYRLDGAAGGTGAVSVANGAGATGGALGEGYAPVGGTGIVRVGERPMGTFPESVQNRFGR